MAKKSKSKTKKQSVVQSRKQALKDKPSKSTANKSKRNTKKSSLHGHYLKWLTSSLLGRLFLISLIAVISGIIFLYFTILRDLPSPTRLQDNPYAISTHIYDRDGELLYEIFADQNRTPINLEDLPDHLKQATIAIEDKEFYTHRGVDIIGLIRGASKLVTEGRAQGGSTITQQLVKNALLTNERTLQRKGKELILTLIIETRYSKDEILEMYLNQIPYGGTAYGVESAAQLYFNKSAGDLTLTESSILAGLPQAPTRYSPFGSNPEAYKPRQQAVLRRMTEDGYISQDQATQAATLEPQFATPTTNIKAPHFVLWVKELLVEKYGQAQVETGGLRVTTSLDYDLQEYSQATVSAQIAENGERYQMSNGAALITNPMTGEVLSMIGSADYYNNDIDGQVNIALRYRQPGSSIKPLNYMLAFHKYGFSPGNIAGDLQTCFREAGVPQDYCPVNYDGSYHGPATIRASLANSYNIPAVKLLAYNGVTDFMTFASKLGITGWNDPRNYGLSLTLGGGEVRMIDMAVAYSNLANLGIKVPLHPILKVTDSTGKVLEEFNCQPPEIAALTDPDADLLFSEGCEAERILNPQAPYLTTHILSDQNARAPSFGSNLNIRNHPDVAVKTGTTNDLKDNWTIGYTPQRLAIVWVGNNDNTPMSRIASGITGAAPIWRSLMSQAITDQETTQLSPPEGVIGTQICALNGTLPSDDCPTTFDLFPEGSEPKESTPLKRPWPIDKTTGGPSRPDTPLENIEMREQLISFDILGSPICLDCPYETQSQIVNYPIQVQLQASPQRDLNFEENPPTE